MHLRRESYLGVSIVGLVLTAGVTVQQQPWGLLRGASNTECDAQKASGDSTMSLRVARQQRGV
jgi:hypothetical protein